MMRKILITLFLIALGIGSLPALGNAEDAKATLAVEAKTGDVEFDATLGNLNIEAKGNLPEFIADLSVTYEVPKETVENLLVKEAMTPADAYLTVGIVKITEKPIETVVETYKANKGKGWGVIAKQLGIKPGSKEFHALKNGGVVELEKAKGKNKEKGEKSTGEKSKGEKPEKNKDKNPKKK